MQRIEKTLHLKKLIWIVRKVAKTGSKCRNSSQFALFNEIKR